MLVADCICIHNRNRCVRYIQSDDTNLKRQDYRAEWQLMVTNGHGNHYKSIMQSAYDLVAIICVTYPNDACKECMQDSKNSLG